MTERLGSYIQFIEDKQLTDSPEVLSEYTLALHALRVQLAKERGLTLEELHTDFNRKTNE